MANLISSLRAVMNIAGTRRMVCGDSIVWAKKQSDDPAVIWTQIDRSDYILRICQILSVDTALLLQAGVDAARVAVALCAEPNKTARTAEIDVLEATATPTNDTVTAIIKLCGLCACGGDNSREARVRNAAKKIPAALQQSMADAVRARIPYSNVSSRFTDDGAGNLTPIDPVP